MIGGGKNEKQKARRGKGKVWKNAKKKRETEYSVVIVEARAEEAKLKNSPVNPELPPLLIFYHVYVPTLHRISRLIPFN